MAAQGNTVKEPTGAEITPSGEFLRGLRMISPVLFGTAAWALVVGMAMVKTGLSVPMALGMTFLVYAGSAQVAALPLIAAGAPVWVVLFTALVMNLRFMIYSAALSPWVREYSRGWKLLLGYTTSDSAFALLMRHVDQYPDRPHRKWFFLGPAAGNWAVWQIMSTVGIVLASQIPTDWGLDFAGTLALAALAMLSIFNPYAGIGALVAGGVALAASGLPLKLGLVTAIIAGIATAMILESRMGTRR